MSLSDSDICVAQISGAYGVRGDVRIRSYTNNPEDFSKYGSLYTDKKEEVFIRNLRWQGKLLRVC